MDALKYLMKRVYLEIPIEQGGRVAADILAERSGLSKSKVKDAMNKGAVWIARKKGGRKRLRKATAILASGDRLEFYYDESLLAIRPPEAKCLADVTEYSVWIKPAGLLAQGTMYGDHCSLLRQAELYFQPRREAFPVHRLDREAEGLMLVAHTKKAAAKLSELFSKGTIEKKYRAEVLGTAGDQGDRRRITSKLDGKASLTEYEVESYDPLRNVSALEIKISSGRLHQIRRHLEMAGFPVMGDPKYGKGNKNSEGLRLWAVSLKFRSPFSNREEEFSYTPG